MKKSEMKLALLNLLAFCDYLVKLNEAGYKVTDELWETLEHTVGAEIQALDIELEADGENEFTKAQEDWAQDMSDNGYFDPTSNYF